MSSGFFEEVKRRKVYRVAAAYIIAAGGVIQLASAAFPAWDLPNWALRLVIALLLLGFPIALVLAWAYDITRAGRSRNTNAGGARIASSPEHHHAGSDRRDHFRCRRVLSPASRLSAQGRQIDCGVAV